MNSLHFGKAISSQRIPMMDLATQEELMSTKEAHIFLSKFQKLKLNFVDEASRYTFFTYVQANNCATDEACRLFEKETNQPEVSSNLVRVDYNVWDFARTHTE